MSILKNNQSVVQLSYQRTAASSVTATQAVRSTTSGNVAPAVTNLRTVLFDGISLNSATTGETVYVSAHGLLDPAVLNLGDGYACAVGTTVAGFPVRATDPSCESAPNWLGHCDAHGNITIAPVRKEVLDPRDFGAVFDDATDDFGPWHALFTNGQPGETIFIPQGTSYVSQNLLPDKRFNWKGANANGAFIHFAAGKGLKLRAASQIGGAFGTDYTRLEGFTLTCTKVTIVEWQASHTYTAGDRVRVKLGDLNVLNDQYQEESSGIHFICKIGGISGGTQPIFNEIAGTDTTDGYVTWTAEDWSALTIQASSITVEQMNIVNPTDNAVYIAGFSSDVTIADAVQVRDCLLASGDGHGISCNGDDANACTFVGNTIVGWPRGAQIKSGFLSSYIAGNNGALARRSYFGPSTAAQSVWVSNYFEANSGPYKIMSPQIWFSGQNSQRAPESTCIAHDGQRWYNGVRVKAGKINETRGADDSYLQLLTRDGDSGYFGAKLIETDTEDPGGYISLRYSDNQYEASEELTAERSIYGLNRRRFPSGFYLGHPRGGTRTPIYITTSPVVPDNTSYSTVGRLIWERGDLVFNQNTSGIGVIPGWRAARRGGWGGGRSWGGGGRKWIANNSSIAIGEGLEPSVSNGKVFRVQKFEVFSGSWVRDDRYSAPTSSTEPTWTTTNGTTTTELLDSTHRIVWECWGDVGMTWDELPAPIAQVDSLDSSWTPLNFANLQWYLTADTGYAGGTWADQSGSGDANRNATQATAGFQPTLNNSNAAFNNQPTLDFDGSDDRLVTGTWSAGLTQPFTVFGVARIVSLTPGGNGYIFSGLTDPPSAGVYEASADSSLHMTAGTTIGGDVAPGTTAFVFVAVFNGATSSLYVSAKTAQTSNQNAGTQAPAGFTIGDYVSHNTLFVFQGSIAQIGAVQGIIPAGDIARYLDYCHNKYGTGIGS